jgi:hypothetical protein
MKKTIRLTESDLYKIVKRVLSENKSHMRELGLRNKLNQIFFGPDETNITSKEGEKGYLSSDWRLDKKISPRQRVERLNQVISELESYLQDLRASVTSEESFLENPEYDKVWGDIESGNVPSDEEEPELELKDSDYAKLLFWLDQKFYESNDKRHGDIKPQQISQMSDQTIEYLLTLARALTKYHPNFRGDKYVNPDNNRPATTAEDVLKVVTTNIWGGFGRPGILTSKIYYDKEVVRLPYPSKSVINNLNDIFPTPKTTGYCGGKSCL